MSEATMSAENPYSAPEAELDSGGAETYTPSIFSFSGRIGRLRYLAYSVGLNIVLTLAMIPIMGTAAFLGGDYTGMSTFSIVAVAVLYIATIVISVMFGKRRMNDLNRSGWWLFLWIVPFVNLALIIYMLFFPGTEGKNNFGPMPSANTIGVMILGWSMPVIMLLGIVAAVMVPMMAGA